MWRAFLLLPPLAACSTGLPPDRTVRATLEYTVTSEPGTKNLRLVVWLPPDLPPAQIVRGEVFRPQPARTFEQGGGRYAEFFFAEPEPETRVRIELELELHRRDLTNAAGDPRREPLTPEERARYLAVEPGLEHDDPLVRRLADQLEGDDVFARLRSGTAIVGDALRYPGYIPLDQGVLATCRRGSGDCSDYSDLLVSIYRADGIPARRLVGLLDDVDGSEVHAWVEAWTDAFGWVSLDPLLTALHEVDSAARLRSTYLAFTSERNDPVLAGWQFASFASDGSSTFAWTWKITSLD